MSIGQRAAIMSLVIAWGMFPCVLAWGQNQPPGQPGKAAQKGDVSPALLKARAEAARKAYVGAFETLKQTRRVENVLLMVNMPVDAYCWSVRWFQAQRDLSKTKEERIAAAAAHLKRMEQLKDRVEGAHEVPASPV